MILSNMCYYFASIQSCSHQRFWRYWKFCRYSCVYIQLRLSEWVSYETKGPLYSSKLRVLIKELKQNIIRDQIFCVNSSGFFFSFFLAYLSQRLKCRAFFFIKICLLFDVSIVSVFIVVVVINFSYFHLLQNHWTKFGTKHPWVKGLPESSNEGPALF